MTVTVATFLLSLPATAAADAPHPVTMYLMQATTPGGLFDEGVDDACNFAHHEGTANQRLMVLAFGRADKQGGEFGADIANKDAFFPNSEILTDGLEGAAQGYDSCRVAGQQATIVYGNNNYKIGANFNTDQGIQDAGNDQANHAKFLKNFENQQNYGTYEDAGAGSDMETGWEGPTKTEDLVTGEQSCSGCSVYFDYGTAGGCPTTGDGGGCSGSAWTVDDVVQVSWSTTYANFALPEIYVRSPDSALQWATVRKDWNHNHPNQPNYYFWGSTGELGQDYTPQDGWSALTNDNPAGSVGQELVCFMGC